MIFAAWTVSAAALDVTVAAGGLREAVGEDRSVSSLTVSGTVDIRDFDYISAELRELKALDISGATIAAYEGEPTFLGRKTSAAGVMPECALMSTPIERLLLPEGLNEISAGAFGGSAIREIVIPESVKVIGAGAFGECRDLTEVVVPASVTEVGAGAFKGCVALVSARVIAPLASVPDAMFQGCEALERVQLPASVKSIGNDAFNGCVALKDMAIPESVASVGCRAFHGSGLERIDLGSCLALRSLGDWSFAGCDALTEAVLPPSMEKIGRGAFYNDGSMAVSELPESLKVIGDFSLRGIGSAEADLMSATAVDSIGAYAMAGWKNMQVLVLPEHLGYMGDGAMANWTALKSINAESVVSVPVLGNDVWKGVDQASAVLVVPADLFEEYGNTPQWREFDVRLGQSGGDATAIPAHRVADEGVSAHFEGLTLHLQSVAMEIVGVQFYDVSGRLYSLPMAAGDGTAVSVDTSAWDAPVMIVRVILADGSSATLKLSR